MENHDVFQVQSALDQSRHLASKKTPVQDRAFSMGNVIGVNGYRVNQDALKKHFTELEYKVQATPHFMICTRAGKPTFLVHRFSSEQIDADLGRYFIEELKPLGLLDSVQNFGDVFGAVVGSVFPRDAERAWHLFGVNTLQRYHTLVVSAPRAPVYESPVDVFATLYRRVCELIVGESLLDAGCSFGFLPLVVAERIPLLRRVVGCDIHAEPFPVTRTIAEERRLTNVEFVQADLLATDIERLGQFDTVTVLHVLEHFSERDMYRVLANLLKVVSRRLIIGVPYEPSEPEVAYGHEQLFTREKLEVVGSWCLQRLGDARMMCEDCMGGLLYIDRS